MRSIRRRSKTSKPLLQMSNPPLDSNLAAWLQHPVTQERLQLIRNLSIQRLERASKVTEALEAQRYVREYALLTDLHKTLSTQPPILTSNE